MSFLAKVWKQIWNPVSIQDVLKTQQPKAIKTNTISPYQSRKPLAKGGSQAFRYEYMYPHVIPFHQTRERMQKSLHPNCSRFNRRYSSMDPGAMWAVCMSSPNLSYGPLNKGIVGSKERTRLRKAFWVSLKRACLDENGRKLNKKHAPSPLKGTLIFYLQPPILDASNKELEYTCHQMIKKLKNLV
jgi:hypothetical protein